MNNKIELSEEMLKGINGGLTLEIPDVLLKNIIGVNWENLAIVLKPFLSYAKSNNIKGTDVVEELLKTRKIDFSNLQCYRDNLHVLVPAANSGGFTEAASIMNKLLELLGD